MGLEKINEILIDFTKGLETKTTFSFYLFGSVLRTSEYNDIDILIVYYDYCELNQVKEKLNKIFFNDLIHITCLTYEEEKEFNFIQKTNCLKITTHNKV